MSSSSRTMFVRPTGPPRSDTPDPVLQVYCSMSGRADPKKRGDGVAALVAVGAQQDHAVGEGRDPVACELEVERRPAALGRLTHRSEEHTSELQSLTNLVC